MFLNTERPASALMGARLFSLARVLPRFHRIAATFFVESADHGHARQEVFNDWGRSVVSLDQ